ncbi:hypothetical protein [Caldimonas sp.]|uniref:hypothetical protein n=1 Tax=Caldimonas sp. TaxID=2838790 RepID=UPI00391A15E7
MQYSALLGALLAAPILAAAQACPSPSFNALNPLPGAESGTMEVRPANQLRMRIPAGMTHLIPSHDALAVHYGDSRRIVVLMDDGYTLKGMSDSKPGPFFANALQGKTEEGCAFLKSWKQMHSATYRSTLTRGPLTVSSMPSRAKTVATSSSRSMPTSPTLWCERWWPVSIT